MLVAGRLRECGATFGIHCLDLGTEIASKTSHNVKMATAGRSHERGQPSASVAVGP